MESPSFANVSVGALRPEVGTAIERGNAVCNSVGTAGFGTGRTMDAEGNRVAFFGVAEEDATIVVRSGEVAISVFAFVNDRVGGSFSFCCCWETVSTRGETVPLDFVSVIAPDASSSFHLSSVDEPTKTPETGGGLGSNSSAPSRVLPNNLWPPYIASAPIATPQPIISARLRLRSCRCCRSNWRWHFLASKPGPYPIAATTRSSGLERTYSIGSLGSLFSMAREAASGLFVSSLRSPTTPLPMALSRSGVPGGVFW
mmetsp:Transcript_18604/g.42491  ORF Transcript_18604/g.42491 Transcript_18604/m.42491 type:complete len:257 (-) Transcript_18604:1978-2748(-)